MKILITEDEFRNFNRLRRLLLDYDDTMIIEGPLESVVDTRKWLQNHQGISSPDVVFADIRLSDGISFEALDTLDINSLLVFTTAYDEYALKAFQYNGLAYLMKPVDRDELYYTLDRIRELKYKTDEPMVEKMGELKQLITQLGKEKHPYRERFLIPYKDGYEVIDVSEVAFICTENRDTRLFLKSGKSYSISMSLDVLEQQLNPTVFFRVNRQYIIEISMIKTLKIYFGGKLRVCLYDFDKLEIMCSRERAPMLKEWLNK